MPGSRDSADTGTWLADEVDVTAQRAMEAGLGTHFVGVDRFRLPRFQADGGEVEPALSIAACILCIEQDVGCGLVVDIDEPARLFRLYGAADVALRKIARPVAVSNLPTPGMTTAGAMLTEGYAMLSLQTCEISCCPKPLHHPGAVQQRRRSKLEQANGLRRGTRRKIPGHDGLLIGERQASVTGWLPLALCSGLPGPAVPARNKQAPSGALSYPGTPPPRRSGTGAPC